MPSLRAGCRRGFYGPTFDGGAGYGHHFLPLHHELLFLLFAVVALGVSGLSVEAS